MPCFRPLLPLLLHCVAHLAPVQPMTSYTQLNHDEPTNAVKETTVTSEQDDFRVPGVGDRDLLWDHVGDLSQHLVAGYSGSTTRDQEEARPLAEDSASTSKDKDETMVTADQIEDSVGNASSTSEERVTERNLEDLREEETKGDGLTTEIITEDCPRKKGNEAEEPQLAMMVGSSKRKDGESMRGFSTEGTMEDFRGNGERVKEILSIQGNRGDSIQEGGRLREGFSTERIKEATEVEYQKSLVTPHLLSSTKVEGRERIDAAETEGRFNRSNVPGKLILYPELSHNSDSVIGNITRNLRKNMRSNGTSKVRQRPQQIIYDTSDPFSVIFGEVKTEFKTDKSSNITGSDRENIIGGLAVRRVEQLLKKEDRDKSVISGGEATTTFKNFAAHSFDEERDQYVSEQEEQELRENSELFEFGRIKASPHDDGLFPKLQLGPGMSEDEDFDKLEERPSENSLFKEWDTVSEEQEKMLEDMVLENNHRLDGSSREALPPPGRWFILLLAGNSTIVKLRQKDFAKYLKLNLAARLSLEYDEVKVNRVVLAPPRLMVNVSVVPSNEGNNQDLDEEIDLEDKVFGEEEAPLHKLAETNATLLELSGEEYHVVRFLSLRSQQPIQLDDSPSATTSIVSDRHTDIEIVIYVVVGGTCALAIIATFFFTVIRYLRTAPINWPWKGAKPNFIPWSLPRHQRMGDEPAPTIGGPLTVIYSGTFVDRTAPNSGSWIEDCQAPSEIAEIPRNQPVYGFGALSSNALPEIGESFSAVQESPRFNLDRKLHILGCRPNHFLLPHQPARPPGPLDVRIPPGVDNPNYQS